MVMNIGGKYNWKNQSERLVYLGYNWSSDGYWHQFATIEYPDEIWCEVLEVDINMLEESSDQESAV